MAIRRSRLRWMVAWCVAATAWVTAARALDFLPFSPGPAWTLYVDDALTPEDAAVLSRTGAAPIVDGRPLPGRTIELTHDIVDLNRVLGRPAPAKSRAILTAPFAVDADGTVQIGVGVDWWFACHVNGESRYSTLATGNNASPYRPNNHIFNVPVNKGVNRIALYVEAGSAGWTVACGPVPVSRVTTPATPNRFGIPNDELPPVPLDTERTKNAHARNRARKAYEREAPAHARLLYGPWLLDPNPGIMTVGFVTDGPVPAGVDYREKGKTGWTRQWISLDGIVRNDNEVHRVTLAGLGENTVYEYRPVLLDPESNAEVVGPEVYEFTSFTSKPRDFSVFLTGDLQFPARERVDLMRRFFSFPAVRDADVLVSLGDVENAFDDFAGLHIEYFLDPVAALARRGRPYVPVRGNHEFRGRQTVAWSTYFGPAYRGFRQGDVYFVVLDNGEDKPSQPYSPHYTGRLVDTERYMAEQKAWLETVVETEAFKTAKFRVVLCHSAPYGHHDVFIQKTARMLVEDIFGGENPKHRIHLWLSGHLHTYKRTLPGTGNILSVALPRAIYASKVPYAFPIVAIDGPGGHGAMAVSGTVLRATNDALQVDNIDINGEVFDQFSVDAQGQVTDGPRRDDVFLQALEEKPMP